MNDFGAKWPNSDIKFARNLCILVLGDVYFSQANNLSSHHLLKKFKDNLNLIGILVILTVLHSILFGNSSKV